MSWMDSWSRPSKTQSTPAPYYLLPGGESTPYCKTCGRVIGARKTDASRNTTPAKYCSSRCKSRKPGALDRRIEEAFVAQLEGKELPTPDSEKLGEVVHIEDAQRTGREQISSRDSKKGKKRPKGDSRVLVSCTTVEILVFGDRFDPEKTAGRKRDRAKRGLPDAEEWTSVDMTDDPVAEEDKEVVDGDLLAQVNGGVGGEKGRAERIEENEEMLQKRMEGQQKAHERELVRCAARRGVIFGFIVKVMPGELEERRKCEAVMQGKVVEPSFAKGEWSIRWREEV
ncbi:hypothetical protein MBLNU13_g09292t1 [Cladosporium sp. NU13]